MAIDYNQPQKIYSIKYTVAQGHVGIEDVPAEGQWDAEQIFKKKHPSAKIINVWRKS